MAKKHPVHIIVTCEYCKARLAAPLEESPPTCYICGGRMLPVKED